MTILARQLNARTVLVHVARALGVVGLVGVGVAGAVAVVHGQHAPANLAVLDAARAPGSLSVRLAHTGSPLPVLVAVFFGIWGLALLGAAAGMLGAWTAWRFTAGIRGPLAELCRLVIVAGAAVGVVVLAAFDVRTALTLALAVAAWRHLQDFTLRGMVQAGFYGGLLLAAAATIQPPAACWALALAWACYLLPGHTRPRGERAAGALVVAFAGVAITCLWALMRLILGGTWAIGWPTPHPVAFFAAAAAGVLLWLSLFHTSRSGVGVATIPVLLAGSTGMLGPGLMVVAVPIVAGLSVVALTLAAHWAMVRLTLVGLAATVASLAAFSTAITGVAGATTAARGGTTQRQYALVHPVSAPPTVHPVRTPVGVVIDVLAHRGGAHDAGQRV